MFYIQNYRDILQWPAVLTLLAGLIYPVLGVRSGEGRLYDDLFMDYNPDVRPVLNVSDVVSVKVGLSIISIRNLDVEAGVLDMLCWVNLEWNDPQLRWDPGKYGGLKSINVPTDVTWSPDITILNLINPLRELCTTRTMISDSGDVFVARSLRTRTNCQSDPDSLDHVCQVTISSWSYDGSKVELNPRQEEIDLSNFYRNRKWKLVHANISKERVVRPCCSVPFPGVVVEMSLSELDET